MLNMRNTVFLLTICLLPCVGIRLTAQEELKGLNERQRAAAKRTADLLGANYGQNLAVLGPAFIKVHSVALSLLNRADVAEELKLSAQQAENISVLTNAQPTNNTLLAERGLKTNLRIGQLTEKKVEELRESVKRQTSEIREKAKDDVEDILSKGQFNRLKQIYLQEVIMNRHGINPELEMGVHFTPEESNELVQGIKRADVELQKEFRRLQYKAYVAQFREVMGHEETDKMLGDAFVVELDYNHRGNRSLNPRRRD